VSAFRCTGCSYETKVWAEASEHRCTDWSEREAVVAYLLWRFGFLDAVGIARGDHMTAARRGDLDGLRERAKEMCRGNG
jgi:hypothetical protein